MERRIRPNTRVSNWMAEQKIELIQLDWRGRTVMVAGNSGYSANAKLVEAQRAAQHGKKKFQIIKWLIREKIAGSLDTLREAVPDSEIQKIAIDRLKYRLKQIERAPSTSSVPKLQGIEGAAASDYFRGWHGLPLRWSELKRRPIPVNWHEIGARKTYWRRSGQNSRHPINAMLNYGYGILVSNIRAQVVAAGFDPFVGIMHGTSQNRIPLIYDLMEPLRPVVDRKILEFALAHTFTPGDFTINKFGGCRINPEMARTVFRACDVRGASVLEGFRKLLLPML